MGDERTYERAVALRAVTSTDAMTADWAHLPYDFMAKVSNDIYNKVKGVNRVCYDISSKPPSTIGVGIIFSSGLYLDGKVWPADAFRE